MSSSCVRGEKLKILKKAQLNIIGLTIAMVAGAIYYWWSITKNDEDEKVPGFTMPRILKRSKSVSTDVIEQVEEATSLCKTDQKEKPCCQPSAKSKTLASPELARKGDEQTILLESNIENISLPVPHQKAEEFPEKKEQKQTLMKAEPGAVVIMFAVYFTSLAFVFRLLLLPVHYILLG